MCGLSGRKGGLGKFGVRAGGGKGDWLVGITQANSPDPQ